MKGRGIRYYETCPKCFVNITKQNIKKHLSSCRGTGIVARIENVYCNYCKTGPFNSIKEWNEHKKTCKFFLDMKEIKDSLGRSKKPRGNFSCEFCGRSFENKRHCDLIKHENCCYRNPNRKDGCWKGKKHSMETRKKIAESIKKAHDEGRGHTWKNRYLNPSYAEQ